MQVFSFILALYRTYPRLLSVNIVVLIVINLMGVFSIFSLAPIIDSFLYPDLTDSSELTKRVTNILQLVDLPVTQVTFIGLFVIFQILKSVLQILAQYLFVRAKFFVLKDLSLSMFVDFFYSRWTFFSSNKLGTLLNTFWREINAVAGAVFVMGLFFANILQAIFFLAVPFYVSWQVTSVSLLVAAVISIPFLALGKWNYSLGQKSTATANDMMGTIQENLSLVKIIQGFGCQLKNMRKYERAFDEHSKYAVKANFVMNATPHMYEPVSLIVVLVTLYTSQVLSVHLSEIVAILWAFRLAMPALGNIVTQKNTLMQNYPGYEQVKRLRAHARSLKIHSGERRFEGFNCELALRNLEFSYTDGVPVLKDINIRVEKGKMVALVGESGSGKSTLIDIVMGFNEPSSGQMTIDGVPYTDYDITSLRQKIGYVPQNSVLFDMTIRENLLWANESATDADIENACRQANACEFIEEFPDKYDTLVGDRGVRLSGGQCQRIALARAILRKPELLILDEATSALDTHSEQLIQAAIDNIIRTTTVIVIAHRLSTIANADYIYVLEDGEIVEAGTQQTLRAEDGLFNDMIRLQNLTAV